jgi:hypothetical protein
MSNEINVSSERNVNSDYFTAPPTDTLKKEEAAAAPATGVTAQTEHNVMDLINSDPQLKGLYDQLVTEFSEKSEEEVFTLAVLIRTLIALSQALQGAATAMAERLSRVTEKLNAYTKLQTQIPILTVGGPMWGGDNQDDRDKRSEINGKFSNMLEAVRANKGMEEDKAKKIQTLLQSMKDAGTAASDFTGTFIDLIRTISTKITQ